MLAARISSTATIVRHFSTSIRNLQAYAEGPSSVLGAKFNSERVVDEVDVVIVGGG